MGLQVRIQFIPFTIGVEDGGGAGEDVDEEVENMGEGRK